MKFIKVEGISRCGSIGFTIELPALRIVCPRCDGDGTHVNPSVDGHGLTAEDFAEDPDFRESYMSGVYDVRCEECDGNRVVDQIDEEACKTRLSWYKGLLRWRQRQDARHASDMEAEYERRWGA